MGRNLRPASGWANFGFLPYHWDMTRTRVLGVAALAALVSIPLVYALQAGQKPEDELAGFVRNYLAMGHPPGWEEVDALPKTKWSPLPPTSLQNCLPDGNCYTRQGSASIGGRTVTIMATGARTMVVTLYLRNAAAPLGQPAVVAALKQAGLGAELARCPVRGSAGSTNWYRLTGTTPGYLAFQTVRGQRPSEGLVITTGADLPRLQPNQLALYSLQCGEGQEQKPVSTTRPHEKLAEVVVALLVPASASAVDWKTLTGLATGIEWLGDGPKPTDLKALKNDPNPVSQTGVAKYAERGFSVLVSGTPAQVKNVYLDEMGRHPRGEHMLGVVYEKGITVRLVRCGPVYTESTNNWYSLQSARTRPAMIQQSIGYDGDQVHDSYALRLDGTLPVRDPRDRDPGVNGCR